MPRLITRILHPPIFSHLLAVHVGALRSELTPESSHRRDRERTSIKVRPAPYRKIDCLKFSEEIDVEGPCSISDCNCDTSARSAVCKRCAGESLSLKSELFRLYAGWG